MIDRLIKALRVDESTRLHSTTTCGYLLFAEVNEESPPEPAPPEVPPRGPSLHATSLRRRPDYALPVDDDGSGQQETFLAQGGELFNPY